MEVKIYFQVYNYHHKDCLPNPTVFKPVPVPGAKIYQAIVWIPEHGIDGTLKATEAEEVKDES